MSNLSFVRHKGDGVTNQFALSVAGENIGYFRISDIHGYVDDKEVPIIIDPNSPHIVRFTETPKLNADVLIRRQMPVKKTYADFERGNNFGHRQVNNTFVQQLYLTQELLDGFFPSGFYFKQDVDLGGHKIVNLGDATEDNDAVSKKVTDSLDKRLDSLENSVSGNSRFLPWTYNAVGGEDTLNPPYKFESARVFINGVRQRAGDSFEIVDLTIMLAEPLEEGDWVDVELGTEPLDIGGAGVVALDVNNLHTKRKAISWTKGLRVDNPIQLYKHNGNEYLPNSKSIPFTTGATFNTDNWVLSTIITRSFFGDKIIFADELVGGLSDALDTAKDGDTIILSNKTYNIVGKHKLGNAPYPAGGWKGNTVKNLRIIGAGMPSTDIDETRFIDGTGTIIQGSLINYVDGFKCFDLGVDVGDYVVDNLAGGEFMDGFIPSTNRMNTKWNGNRESYNNDIHVGNIKILAKNPEHIQSQWKHACLYEHVDGGTHGYLEIIGGFYGFAFKSRNVQALGDVVIRRSTYFSVIFKTDEYSQCLNYTGRTIRTGLDRYPFISGSIVFRSTNGTQLKGISFDWVGRNCKGIEKNGTATAPVEDVTIRSVDVSDCPAIAINMPDNAHRWNIGQHSIVNATYGILVPSTALQCHIGNGTTDGASRGITGYILDGDVSHGNITARRHKKWGVENKGAVVNRALIKGTQNTLGNLSGVKDVTSEFTLVNGWKPTSGNPFKVTHAEGRFYFSGEVTGGTNDQVIKNIPFATSPKTETNTLVAYDGTDWVNKICIVSGEVRVINAANQAGFISLDGIELYAK